MTVFLCAIYYTYVRFGFRNSRNLEAPSHSYQKHTQQDNGSNNKVCKLMANENRKSSRKFGCVIIPRPETKRKPFRAIYVCVPVR